MKVYRITTNYLTEAEGIDNYQPVFSWKLDSSVASDKQTAYRIVCTPVHGIGDMIEQSVWDSGKIKGDTHIGIPYEGGNLQDLTKYEVRVMVWDKEGIPSPFSFGFFITGYCTKNLDAIAQWITQEGVRRFHQNTLWVTGGLENSLLPSQAGLAEGMYLYKAFLLEKPICTAYLSVCGIGFYHTYLNGRHVGNCILDPAQTDYHARALYHVFDVKSYLKKDHNACLVVLGNGRQIEAYGYEPIPRLIFALTVTYEDGSVKKVISDRSWKGSSGPIKENSIYEGEKYDARCELTGWEQDGYDVSHWEEVKVISGYPLEAQQLPPVCRTDIRKAEKITKTQTNAWIVDFGQNLSGYVRLTIHGADEGQKIILHFSELLTEQGELLRATARNANTEDSYICSGRDDEIFEPSFTYHGFRYAEIINYPRDLKTEDLEAVVLHTNLEQTGMFSSSNSLFNNIHENIRWSQRSNVMGIPTDCPQREERMGWLGDVQLASRQAVFDFDMAAFYRKFLDDIRLSQRKDGALSDVTPPYWPLYPADPAWGTAYVTLLWRLYFDYGDRTSIRKHYENVKRYVDFLFRNSTNGILENFGKYGDWCPPASVYPKRTPVSLTSTWFMLKDTLLVSKFAEILERVEDGREYTKRVAFLKKAFNSRFNNQGFYQTTPMSPIDNQPSMTSQILPLYLGIVPAADEKRAVALLLDEITKRFDYHTDCGIVGTRYLLPTLMHYGYEDIAYKLMNSKTYPSIGYMIEMGATTLWERWEYLAGMGMNSHNHIMFGSLNAWFYQGLCGILPKAPGWETITIAPFFPDSMDYAEASVDTIQGIVHVHWQRDEEAIRVFVLLPVGVRGTFTPKGHWKVQSISSPWHIPDVLEGGTEYRFYCSR